MKVELSLQADRVLLGGSFFTNDELTAGAGGIAILRDRIIGTGDSQEIMKYVGPKTDVFSFPGCLIVPGFFGAGPVPLHMELRALGIDLSNVSTVEELKENVISYFERDPEKEWFFGYAFHSNLLKKNEKEFGDFFEKECQEKAVVLINEEGTCAWLNPYACSVGDFFGEREGISDPREREKVAGLFMVSHREGVVGSLLQFKRPTLEEKKRALYSVLEEARRRGITYLEGRLEDLDVFRACSEERILTATIGLWGNINTPFDELRAKSGELESLFDPALEARGLFAAVDGTLATHTALLQDPAAPDALRGGSFFLRAELKDLVLSADAQGYQLSIKASGDGAVAIVLQVFQEAIRANGKRESRHRIEGLQLVRKRDVKKIADLGLSVGIRMPLFPGEMKGLNDLVEENGEICYFPCRSLLLEGLNFSLRGGGIASLMDPFQVLAASLEKGPSPGEALSSIEEAIQALTLFPAVASFREDEEGTLTPGKLANIAVLSGDPREMEPDAIQNLEVLATFFRGQPVFLTEPLSEPDGSTPVAEPAPASPSKGG